MPSPIAPSFSPSAAASAASSAASGARGRNAEEPGGRSFDAALARSRNAGAAQAPEEAESSALEATHRRKASRAGDRKDELAAELLPMSFFAPLVVPPSAATAALAAGAPAAASMPDGIQAVLPGDAPADTLAGETADAAAGKTAMAADAEGETTAPTKPTHGAQQAPAPDAAQPADARAAVQAAAAVPPPAAGTGTDTAATPAADAAAPETGTHIAAAPAAAATDPRGASTASLSADADTHSAPATAMISADKTADLAAASDAAAPASDSVPTPMPFTPAAAAAARTNVPPASPHTPILSVEPSVGSAAWGKAIGHQVLRMTAAGYQVAELNLNPAGLGPLKVTLTMGDNQAQAMFASAHESVRKALEVALPQLRTSLADHGISLGQASVGAESHPSPGQSGAFGQQPQQQGSPRQADYAAASRAQAIATTEPLRSMPAPAALRRPSAGVDTFA
ncbi:flagellar hook-length control protein FliK [Variovorax paradoxus]|uniref:flagellar hook-length control protein FliK n=1 Tax=Variovorax paradoxus TaxID=34073 RepID=UPI0028569DC6|nr:flagellar hook-length control protein FliK [Variovorax paradoxus]MDR6451156.1 flagellar hook-length control protein FliK [Variovorax paradoxus]